MRSHTVTVKFDDEKVQMETIIAALHDAGYVVKGQRRID
jgi:copper chaperone CopZ